VGYCLSKFLNCSFYITVEARVYTVKCFQICEGFLGKGFAVRVWALFFCVFIPVAFGLGGKKVPSIFGIKILI
jgi:hypothetical protein